MGNASSMLTQYDIEEVQDHCNKLCRLSVCFVVFLLILPFGSISNFDVSWMWECSLSARNCFIVPKVLPVRSKCKGIYIFWWVPISSRVCNESALSGSLLSWFIGVINWILGCKYKFVVQSLCLCDVLEFYVKVWVCFVDVLNLLHLQRLLKMVDGLNFKDFVAFLSAFSAKASVQQKIQSESSLSFL